MEFHLKKKKSPNNGIVLNDAFRPKLLNIPLASYFQ